MTDSRPSRSWAHVRDVTGSILPNAARPAPVALTTPTRPLASPAALSAQARLAVARHVRESVGGRLYLPDAALSNALDRALRQARPRTARVRERGTAPDSNSASPSAQKWITIHPHGKGTKGQPVLVKGEGSETTIAGGLGGKYNGRPLHEAFSKKAETGNATGSASTLTSGASAILPRHNPHLARFAPLKEFGVDPTVAGTPQQHEGGHWSVHLPHAHESLLDLAHSSTPTTPGGATVAPHPSGAGVLYRSGPQQASPSYADFANKMGEDVTAHRVQAAQAEHEKRMQDEAEREYQQELEREMAQHRQAQMKAVRDLIRAEGGIARYHSAGTHNGKREYFASEYDALPHWAKNRTGQPLDRMASLVAAEVPSLGIEDANDLHDYLMAHERERRGGYTKAARETEAGEAATAERAVLEAARQTAPHWITLHPHNSDKGTVHIFVGESGHVLKGPKALLGAHVGDLAKASKRATHHFAGQEPEGAREHPSYAETPPPAAAGKRAQGRRPSAQEAATALAQAHEDARRAPATTPQTTPLPAASGASLKPTAADEGGIQPSRARAVGQHDLFGGTHALPSADQQPAGKKGESEAARQQRAGQQSLFKPQMGGGETATRPQPEQAAQRTDAQPARTTPSQTTPRPERPVQPVTVPPRTMTGRERDAARKAAQDEKRLARNAAMKRSIEDDLRSNWGKPEGFGNRGRMNALLKTYRDLYGDADADRMAAELTGAVSSSASGGAPQGAERVPATSGYTNPNASTQTQQPQHTPESVDAAWQQHRADVLRENPDLAAHIERTQAERAKHDTNTPAGRHAAAQLPDASQHEKWVDREARARLSPEQRQAARISDTMAQRVEKPAAPASAQGTAPSSSTGPGTPGTPNPDAEPPYKAEQRRRLAERAWRDAYKQRFRSRLALPSLEGTEKQTPWATSVRDQHIDALLDSVARAAHQRHAEGHLTEHVEAPGESAVRLIQPALDAQRHSRFWIDNRSGQPTTTFARGQGYRDFAHYTQDKHPVRESFLRPLSIPARSGYVNPLAALQRAPLCVQSTIPALSDNVRESAGEEGGAWRTIHGAHVQLDKAGTVVAGPKSMRDKQVADKGDHGTGSPPGKAMPTHETLDAVHALVKAHHASGRPLYVRYSRGPQADAKGGYRSTNHASGTREAGLSVNNLISDVLPNARNDIAQRLHEYSYLVPQGGAGTRAWLAHGREVGRGADNEPLLADVTPLGWVGEEAAREAREVSERRDALNQKRRQIERHEGPFSPAYKAFMANEYDKEFHPVPAAP